MRGGSVTSDNDPLLALNTLKVGDVLVYNYRHAGRLATALHSLNSSKAYEKLEPEYQLALSTFRRFLQDSDGTGFILYAPRPKETEW